MYAGGVLDGLTGHCVLTLKAPWRRNAQARMQLSKHDMNKRDMNRINSRDCRDTPNFVNEVKVSEQGKEIGR